jgi:hypothetical protein
LFPDAAASNHGVFYKAGRPVTVSELYANLDQTVGGGAGLASRAAAAADPGEGAFTAYAGAARTERQREQAMLVNFILTDGQNDQSPTSAMFSSEMLSVLSQANDRKTP